MERNSAGNLEAKTELEERPMYENTLSVSSGEHYSGRNFIRAIPKILIGTVIAGGLILGVRYCRSSSEYKSWNEERTKLREEERKEKERIAFSRNEERTKLSEEKKLYIEKVAKEKERVASFIEGVEYIYPGAGKTKIYRLENGSYAVVSDPRLATVGRYLNLVLDDKVRFVSSSWDNFRLNELYLKQGDTWEEFNLRNRPAWQRRYEDLVIEVYKARRKSEGVSEEDFDEKFRNDSGKP